MGKLDKFICLTIASMIKVIYRNRLLILNYHSVLDKNELFFSSDIDEKMFDWQMEIVSRYFKPLLLNDAVDKLYANQLPGNAIVVTFDDGYKDNITRALSVLKRRNVKATIFIATGFLNGGIMWNDIVIESIKKTSKDNIDLSGIGLGLLEIKTKEQKIKAIQTIVQHIKYQQIDLRIKSASIIEKECLTQESTVKNHHLMMNDEDIGILQNAGMEIGGHTENHPILACESEQTVIDEVNTGKACLENITNHSLTSFAYPNGKSGNDYLPEHCKIIDSAGFSQAVTTNWGLNTIKTPRFELNRFTPWDKSPIRFMLRILKLYIFNQVR